jgi:hypothetical protein
MHKRTETYELNIPSDDIECWDRYPKHRWVYELSRVLDAQNIKWSPFKTDVLNHKVVNMCFTTNNKASYEPGFIYIEEPQGTEIVSEVYIVKDEIKLIKHFNKETQEEIQEYSGNIELRINAFVSMHFQKFTGIISVDSIGNNIVAIRLRPYCGIYQATDTEITKLIKRIYKKTDIILSGLADQVIHETLAS